MVEIIMKIDGMMCSMCAAHINDIIRRSFRVKKVTASHAKGECVIIAENEIEEDLLRAAVSKAGYTVLSVTEAAYGGKGLFHK